MKVTDIPFNQHLGIGSGHPSETSLELAFQPSLTNHLGTFHAGAQFALAEACSGLALQQTFPELAEAVVPVLRRTETKFHQPATSDLVARTNLPTDTATHFRQQLDRRGRAAITVVVEVVDREGSVTMTGSFQWFVQKLSPPTETQAKAGQNL